jgi:hypothetical protein
MKKTGLIMLMTSLAGCSVYRVTPEEKSWRPEATAQAEIIVSKVNPFFQGSHCFEPMLYVLTLGIVPTHCVDTYSITVTAPETEPTTGIYTITRMNGWLPLFLIPSPSWHYGSGPDKEADIVDLIRKNNI